ncbi:hypothetical protein [Ammoniphilus sp. CFH 90114]|uniref:hypothetical protein n=1 Tax=Ammoniphilus sp. CFH 90114 TaxID=2493665 RepID=UPI00100E231E|nr:hypothetical protein [Ammoniphilus sp. CFH 90114]RXT06427.1 hypothetical protein EIZ39_15265 [Ammoniphilus sp. CFH 90114]
MNYEDEYVEIDYFDDEEYEEYRRQESAKLSRNTVMNMESRYGCSLPQFILSAQTADEKRDLLLWSLAVRFLARYEEKLYS